MQEIKQDQIPWSPCKSWLSAILAMQLLLCQPPGMDHQRPVIVKATQGGSVLCVPRTSRFGGREYLNGAWPGSVSPNAGRW